MMPPLYFSLFCLHHARMKEGTLNNYIFPLCPKSVLCYECIIENVFHRNINSLFVTETHINNEGTSPSTVFIGTIGGPVFSAVRQNENLYLIMKTDCTSTTIEAGGNRVRVPLN